MRQVDVEIIKLFELQDGHLSGAQLSTALGISRTAIWKHINNLRELGYEILATPGLGYRLISKPDILTSGEIKAVLQTKLLGNKVVVLQKTESTNDIAKEHARSGTEEGLLIVAGEQTKGRGRRGRLWHSDLGGLYFSILLRPKLALADISQITLLIAVSIVQVLQEQYQLAATIKWPNDILINDKKVGGILTELSADAETVKYLIIGIGINCNNKIQNWPAEVKAIGASLATITGKQIDRKQLLSEILTNLEKNYTRFISREFNELIPLAKQFSCVLGREITVHTTDHAFKGQALDINDDGSLLIQDETGKLLNLWAGDVSVRK